MTERAHAFQAVGIPGASHALAISHADRTAAMILEAAAAPASPTRLEPLGPMTPAMGPVFLAAL